MPAPRDAAAVRIFPPGVPLLVILAGVAWNHLWPIELGPRLEAPARYWIGGAIVDRGPFRITRDPMYLGLMLLCVGIAVMLMNWWIPWRGSPRRPLTSPPTVRVSTSSMPAVCS